MRFPSFGKLSKRLLTLGLLVALDGTAHGQVVRKDANALQVLLKSAAALGIHAARVSTVTASGAYTQFGGGTSMTSSLRVLGALPDRVRWETDGPKGLAVTVVSGRTGFSRFGARSIPLSVGQTVSRGLEYLPVLALAQWVSGPDFQIDQTELVAIAGKQYHRISIHQVTHGQEVSAVGKALEQVTGIDLFVDVSTNLPAWLRANQCSGDWRVNVPVDLVFSGYRVTRSLLLPMTITRYIDAQKTGEVRFQSFTVNPAYPNSISRSRER